MDPRRREDMIHISTSDVYIFSNFGQESCTEVYNNQVLSTRNSFRHSNKQAHSQRQLSLSDLHRLNSAFQLDIAIVFILGPLPQRRNQCFDSIVQAGNDEHSSGLS